MEKTDFLIDRLLICRKITRKNVVEYGLLNWAIPNKTLGMAGSKCKYGKISKTGKELKPLWIRNVRKTTSFKNINIKNLRVSWYENKKVWMTSSIFTEWVTQLNKQMKQRKRKILLFIDNFPENPSDLSFLNVKVQFLKHNTTSHLQLDQEIFQATLWKVLTPNYNFQSRKIQISK